MGTPDHVEQQGLRPAVRVSMPEAVRQGVYGNLALVSYSGHEFSVDLCQVQHGADGDKVRADVVSRVHPAPRLAAALVHTLHGQPRRLRSEVRRDLSDAPDGARSVSGAVSWGRPGIGAAALPALTSGAGA